MSRKDIPYRFMGLQPTLPKASGFYALLETWRKAIAKPIFSGSTSEAPLMYLTSIEIQNLGPISQMSFRPSVDGENPTPLVIVETNGSGKTTLLSTIVSALVAFKQQAFENAEIDANKVFRLRGTRFLRTGESYYSWELQFGPELKVSEWCLNQTRKKFEESATPKPQLDEWRNIPDEQNSAIFKSSPHHGKRKPACRNKRADV